MNSLICPISKDKTNRNVVRITGFLVAATVFSYIVTGNIYIILGLSIDFYVRAFTNLNVSPYSFVAKKIANLLKLKVIFISKAPKIFAARVGFIFTVAIITLSFNLPIASVIVAFALISFALLESLLNICVGCIVYTYLVLPFYKKSNV